VLKRAKAGNNARKECVTDLSYDGGEGNGVDTQDMVCSLLQLPSAGPI